MLILLILLTFMAGILLDHYMTRRPILVVDEEAASVREPPARLAAVVAGGFKVPDNFRYHPGHTWAVAETPQLVRIGIDDLAAKVAGPLSEIEIPQRGQWIRQGQKIIALRHENHEVDLVSPIEGTVAGINEAVLRNPELAHKDPYGEGWLLTVNSPDAETNFRNLLGGTTARKWMEDSAARLRRNVPVGAVAHDGGLAVEDVATGMEPDEFKKLARELFLT